MFDILSAIHNKQHHVPHVFPDCGKILRRAKARGSLVEYDGYHVLELTDKGKAYLREMVPTNG